MKNRGTVGQWDSVNATRYAAYHITLSRWKMSPGQWDDAEAGTVPDRAHCPGVANPSGQCDISGYIRT